ncbi:Hypothetical protein CINCED_3A009257 [Cinara cedri]|uniref:BHLH domain-containing protein n=1 Tax=Cinara cedri TaxID=506608 RepID=A0A5E4N880_9HEMI|nr:Hypothetical protein CINCED_3A009257 [Cinara cedri]
MGRRRPDWWSEQQQQQQQQQQQEQRRQEQHRQLQDLSDDGCPRNAANARERARMRVLSKAFSRLKTTLPWVPADTKLSKLDTLRLATTYIAHLSSLLATSEQPDVAPAGERAATAAVPIAVTSSLPPTYSVAFSYSVKADKMRYLFSRKSFPLPTNR